MKGVSFVSFFDFVDFIVPGNQSCLQILGYKIIKIKAMGKA